MTFRQVLKDCGITAKGTPLARKTWDVAGLIKRLVDSKASEVAKRKAKP